MKKSYKISIILLSLLLILGFYFYNSFNRTPYKEKLHTNYPTADFIYSHLVENDEKVSTDIDSNEYLSESLGLWLYYLAEVEDEEHFSRAVKVLKKNYLLKNKTVAWRIKSNEKANTNALIDDMRIVKALFLMAEKTNDEAYLKLAKQISKSLLEYNFYENIFVDFYDKKLRKASDQLTLLYVDPITLQYFLQYQLINKNQYETIKSLFEKIDTNQVFYPKTYDIIQDEFVDVAKVNLIEQLYLAIHLEQFDIDTTAFYEWLDEHMKEEGLLFGQYQAKTKSASVTYESPAVYGLAYFYAKLRSDDNLAQTFLDKMLAMKNTTNSAYYGGYLAHVKGKTHVFDNLIPLIAEEHANHD